MVLNNFEFFKMYKCTVFNFIIFQMFSETLLVNPSSLSGRFFLNGGKNPPKSAFPERRSKSAFSVIGGALFVF